MKEREIKIKLKELGSKRMEHGLTGFEEAEVVRLKKELIDLR